MFFVYALCDIIVLASQSMDIYLWLSRDSEPDKCLSVVYFKTEHGRRYSCV